MLLTTGSHATGYTCSQNNTGSLFSIVYLTTVVIFVVQLKSFTIFQISPCTARHSNLYLMWQHPWSSLAETSTMLTTFKRLSNLHNIINMSSEIQFYKQQTLLRKISAPKLFIKFFIFYGTKKSIARFTTAHHWIFPSDGVNYNITYEIKRTTFH